MTLDVWKKLLARLMQALECACREVYQDRLKSLVVFGSVARGNWNRNSDLDIVLVCSSFPKGRFNQLDEFTKVEENIENILTECQKAGWNLELSPVFKTPRQVEEGSPLFLDMTLNAIFLFDENDLVKNRLEVMRVRMAKLKSTRVSRGHEAWTWILKPDFKPGDTIVL